MTLERAEANSKESTQYIMEELVNRNKRSGRDSITNIWLQKGSKVREQCRKVYYEIDWVKYRLKYSGNANGITNDQIIIASNAIKEFNSYISQIDSGISVEFGNQLFLSGSKIKAGKDITVLATEFLANTSREEGIIALTKIQVDIHELEKRLVQFCLNSIPIPRGPCIFNTAMIFQNYQSLSPGEKLEIVAGLTTFDPYAKPKFIINGNKIPADEAGWTKYELKVNKASGTYHIPVRIEYTDLDGDKQIFGKTITYTIR